jgi:hypothetical protein
MEKCGKVVGVKLLLFCAHLHHRTLVFHVKEAANHCGSSVCSDNWNNVFHARNRFTKLQHGISCEITLCVMSVIY